MDRLRSYFSFERRANRARYWLTVLALYAALFVTGLIAFSVPVLGVVVGLLGFVAALWAGTSVAIRRLHDRGKSGWWLLPMYLPVLVFSGLSELMQDSSGEPNIALAALSLPFSIWILVELGCLKGTVGPNRFGPDPLAPSEIEVFS